MPTNPNPIARATEQPTKIQVPEIRREVRNTIDYYFSKLEDGQLRDLPKPEHRQILLRASQDLHAVLRPVSQARAEMVTARRVLAAMFTGYPNLKGDPTELTAAFALHLQDQPLFAIAAACNAVKTGSDSARRLKLTPEFPPTAGQLWQLAEEISGQFARDKAKADELLAAKQLPRPEPTPAERAKVAQHMASLGETLAMANPRPTRKLPSEEEVKAAQERNDATIIREYKAAGIEPYRNRQGTLVSLALMRSVGATIEKRGDRKIVVPAEAPPEESRDE